LVVTRFERQKIAEATRAQMQARAQEKGVTLPQHRGPRTGAASGRRVNYRLSDATID
jgi:hypothetical protein